MNYRYNQISVGEKIIAILSYLTSGIVGFIWILIGFFARQSLKPFLKYHIFQSIFLAFLFFILGHVIQILCVMLSYVPYVNAVVGILNFVFNVSILNVGWYHLSIINFLCLIFLIYVCLSVCIGKYTYIPWVSNIIKYNIN